METKQINKTRGTEMVKGTYTGKGLRFMTIDKEYDFIELHKTYVMVIDDENEPVFLIKEDFENVQYTNV